jgi:hypothetical protein
MAATGQRFESPIRFSDATALSETWFLDLSLFTMNVAFYK